MSGTESQARDGWTCVGPCPNFLRAGQLTPFTRRDPAVHTLRRPLVTLIVACLAAQPLIAQQVGIDSTGVWFPWMPVSLMARGDSVTGLELTTFPNSGGVDLRTKTGFDATFALDSVAAWLTSVDEILSAPIAAPDSLRGSLMSSVLRDAHGHWVVVRRERKKRRWDPSPTIAFVADSTHVGYRLALTTDEAIAFLSTLRWFNDRARHLAPPPSRPIDPSVVGERDSAALDEPPAVVRPGRGAYPPTPWLQGESGLVDLSFIIDSTGTPEPTSVRVTFASAPEFVHPAISAALSTKFRPGRLHGHAVRVLVTQRVRFARR